MKIAYNPINSSPILSCPENLSNDIVFDLSSKTIFIKGIKLKVLNSIEDASFNPISIDLTREWQPTGLVLSPENGFETGLYAIKILSGGLMFSGIASVVVGDTNADDEIVLHMGGLIANYADGTQGRIYAKIAPSQVNKQPYYGEIYLSTSVPEQDITNLSIKMKKLM